MADAMGAHESPRYQTCVWLTPPAIIKALGPFDFDPCPAPAPRPWPTAASHHDGIEDGLAVPWHGRVWLNPPYGGPHIIGPWMRRMVAHGRGAALIFARTETNVFFETVWQAASAVMFLRGRLHFHYPNGTRAKGNAGAPSVLVAYGTDDAECLRNSGLSGRYLALIND